MRAPLRLIEPLSSGVAKGRRGESLSVWARSRRLAGAAAAAAVGADICLASFCVSICWWIAFCCGWT